MGSLGALRAEMNYRKAEASKSSEIRRLLQSKGVKMPTVTGPLHQQGVELERRIVKDLGYGVLIRHADLCQYVRQFAQNLEP